MTIMITGGTGLMGSCIAQRLVDRGERPVLFARNPALWRIAGIRDKVDVVQGDVQKLHEILRAIKKYKVSSIVHLAYLLGAESNANPLGSAHINCIGTVNVYEAARLMECERVCTASSIAVYGFDDEYDPSELPLHEDVPMKMAKGVLPYSSSKIYMEALARLYREQYGTFICGLRPGIVYGWGRLTGSTAFFVELIEKPAKGEPARISGGNAKVTMVYNDDVVDQWITLLYADKSRFKRFFYNTGGDTATVWEVGEIVKKLIPGANITVERGDEKSLFGFAATLSDRSIREDFGCIRKFSPLEVGIEAMIREVKERSRGNS
jgi:nucleoside-diphosphate-sugar epimerase